MKKYPMTWLYIIGMTNLFGGLTIWRFVDYFTDFFATPYDVIFGVYLGLSSLVWLVILFIFWNKFSKIEEKTRKKNFKNKLEKGGTIVLIIRRNIFANVSLIFSAILLFVFLILLFPSPEFSGIGYTVTRIFGGVWFIYGLLFSCFIYTKKVFFSNGKFTIIHTDGIEIIEPNEICDIKLKVKDETNDDPRQLFFADIEIELLDGRKLVCNKADKVMSLDTKIKAIQKYCARENSQKSLGGSITKNDSN